MPSRDRIPEQARILIIDDEEIAVEVLARNLAAGGFCHLEKVTDPREASARFEEFDPDLVILDWAMPGLSGLEVLQQIRADIPPETYLPILVLTAHPRVETKLEALANGATDFLTKPCDALEIVLRVNNLLETRFLHQEMSEQNRALTLEMEQRQKAEKLLRQERDDLRDFFENATVGLHWVGEDGTILWANQAELDLAGYTREEYIGRSFMDFHADAEVTGGILTRLLNKESLHDQEARLQCKDGSSKHVLISSNVLWRDGKFVHTRCFTRDNTPRREAEDALRLSEKKLKRAVTGADLGTWDLEIASGAVSCSARMEMMCGLPEGGGNHLDIFLTAIHPEDRAAALAEMKRAIETQSPYEITHRVVWPDGTVRWISARGGVRTDKEGRPVHVTGTVHDVTERKAVEDTLRETEARFQAMLDHAPVVIFIKDLEGRFLNANRRLLELFGVSEADLIGQNTYCFAPEGVADSLRDNDRAVVRAGKAMSFEETVQFPNGEAHVFLTSKFPLRDQAGAITAVCGIAVDMTERKRAEEALRESEERYAAIVANAPGMVYRIIRRPDDSVVERFASEGCRALLGFEPADFKRDLQLMMELVHPDDRAGFARANEEAVQTRRDWRWEGRVRLRSGEEKWIQGAAGRTERSDGFSIWDGFLMDVTERKQAEGLLRSKSEQLTAVTDTLADYLASGDWPAASHALLRSALGQTESEYGFVGIAPEGAAGGVLHVYAHEGINWDKLIGRELYEEAMRTYAEAGYLTFNSLDNLFGKVITTGQAVVANMPAKDPRAGGRIPVGHPPLRSFLGVPILKGDEVVGVIGVANRPGGYTGQEQNAIDILCRATSVVYDSHLRRKHEVLLDTARQEARAEAERANAAKSEFLSRMSHELRTPLNAILGFAQLAEMDAHSAEEQENIAQILQGGKHLLQLINEVLDISRIEAGEMPLTIEPVSLERSLSVALSLVRPLAAGRQISLGGFACDGYVLADEQRLQQLLLNLLSNAIKYNQEGGSVTVTCHETTRETLRLDVSDTGIGIAEVDCRKIFQPFERLEASKSTEEGVGLGLAICQRLIRLMNGTLTVESAVGTGSTFSIELPIARNFFEPAAQPPLPAAPSITPPPAGLRTLLYIEDNASNLKLIERIIGQRPGLRMIAAQQGSLGLELAREHRPDLILLDLHLPDMNGDQVLVWLRSEPRTADIPVIVISADAIGGEIERLKELGASAYVTKPFEVPKLLQVIDAELAHQVAPN